MMQVTKISPKEDYQVYVTNFNKKAAIVILEYTTLMLYYENEKIFELKDVLDINLFENRCEKVVLIVDTLEKMQVWTWSALNKDSTKQPFLEIPHQDGVIVFDFIQLTVNNYHILKYNVYENRVAIETTIEKQESLYEIPTSVDHLPNVVITHGGNCINLVWVDNNSICNWLLLTNETGHVGFNNTLYKSPREMNVEFINVFRMSSENYYICGLDKTQSEVQCTLFDGKTFTHQNYVYSDEYADFTNYQFYKAENSILLTGFKKDCDKLYLQRFTRDFLPLYNLKPYLETVDYWDFSITHLITVQENTVILRRLDDFQEPTEMFSLLVI